MASREIAFKIVTTLEIRIALNKAKSLYLVCGDGDHCMHSKAHTNFYGDKEVDRSTLSRWIRRISATLQSEMKLSDLLCTGWSYP